MSDPAPTTAPCASCGELVAAEVETFPFCSKRCKAEDLHNWLSGAYQPPTWDEDDEVE